MAGTGNAAPEIAVVNQAFMSAFDSGNAANVVAHYTIDGELLPPQSDTVTGHGAIQAFWQGALDAGIKQVKLETVELEDHGETAVEVGKYTLLAEGGQIADTGKYIVVWKNDKGTWKLHRDIWNTSQAAT